MFAPDSKRLGVLWLAVLACGAPSSPPAGPVEVSSPPQTIDQAAKHDEIVAAHRKIEEAQQDALGATCDVAKPQDAHERCLPSCYATEPADPQAGKKLGGRVEIIHLACKQAADPDAGPWLIADEVDRAKLTVRAVRGRLPHGHKKGTWQQIVESALTDTQHVARGDVIVLSGAWRDLTHPVTKERLRCVTYSHYAKSLRHPIDACGTDGALACEAIGNAAARGINVVHYRLAEARLLRAAGKSSECQEAALEAVAVARGMPRWRQYAKLNVARWTEHPGYRTRFDGTLDEDTLFANAATLGGEAEATYTACGGPAGAPTTATQEQSFHTCW